MRRLLFTFVLAAFASIGWGQSGLAQDGCFYPINECALFGGTKVHDDLSQTDQEFVRTAIQTSGTKEAAADRFIEYGWQSFSDQDLALAMERFNQAWLVDPDNGSAFHGMAVIVHVRDNNVAQADLLYQAALSAQRLSNQYVYADMGQFLGRTDRHDKAVIFLRKVLELNPATPGVRANLAISLLSTDSKTEACEVVREAQDLGEIIKETLFDLACGADE